MHTTTTKLESNLYPEGFSCPICKEDLLKNSWTCENGHTFSMKEGVVQLMETKFKADLAIYLKKFESYRAKAGWCIQDTDIFPQLPYITEELALGFWKAKQYDVEIIRNHIHNQNGLKILDLGAWNGWLSNALSQDGHQLTAIDYFINARDGLAAMQFYPNSWTAIQMDLNALEVLPSDFDLIVVNRCLPYFRDPHRSISLLKEKLAPMGKLIITGIAIYHFGEKRKKELATYTQKFKKENGFDMFFKPVKGYLDKGAYHWLKKEKVQLYSYRKLWKNNLKSRLLPKFPRFFIGVYHPKATL